MKLEFTCPEYTYIYTADGRSHCGVDLCKYIDETATSNSQPTESGWLFAYLLDNVLRSQVSTG